MQQQQQQPDISSDPITMEKQKRVDMLGQHVQEASRKLQGDIVEKLKIKERHETCMIECRPTLVRAREIMDETRQRAQTYQSTFTLDKKEFIEKRLVKVEDALIVEKANQCQNKCQQPTEILKRILQSNLKEVSNNI